MNHTPGPWVIGRQKGQETDIDAPCGDGTIKAGTWWGLATVYGHDDEPKRGTAVMTANARLIAAAPDMLEVIEKTFDYLDALPNLPDNDELATICGLCKSVIEQARGKV